MSKLSTREKIIHVADRLFYENGFEKTSFNDIAHEIKISKGNFYYHFKSKDDILKDVINYRKTKTKDFLKKWELQSDNPVERIKSFVNILIMNKVKISRYGCPVGTLCAELAKLEHKMHANANDLFLIFKKWISKQFVDAGLKKNAEEMSMHLLALSQGVATIASTFKDAEFIDLEVDRINLWVDSVIKE